MLIPLSLLHMELPYKLDEIPGDAARGTREAVPVTRIRCLVQREVKEGIIRCPSAAASSNSGACCAVRDINTFGRVPGRSISDDF